MSDDFNPIPQAQPGDPDALAIPPATPAILPLPDVTPSPRAISVAGPLPTPPTNAEPVVDPAVPANYTPPVVENSGMTQPVMDDVKSMPNDEAFDTAVALNKGDIRWPLEYFKGIKPDVIAQVSKLAQANGVPYPVADVSKDDLQNIETAKGIWASLSSTDTEGNFIYPNTIQWLKDPVNMAKSQDDVAALANIEHVIKQRQQAGESGWFQTLRGVASGLLNTGVGGTLRIPGYMAAIAGRGFEQLGDDQGPIGQTFNDLTGNTFADAKVPNNPKWLDNFFGLASGAENEANAIAPVSFEGRTPLSDLEKGDVLGAAETGLGAMSAAIPTIALAALDPPIALAQGAGSAGGQQYGADLAAGKSQDQAGQDAITDAIVNFGIGGSIGHVAQFKSFQKLFSDAPTTENTTALLGRLARQTFASGTQGAVAQAAITGSSDASDFATGNPHALDNESDKLLNAALIGFATDGSLTGLMAALHARSSVTQQQAGQSWWSMLTGATTASKLRDRDPEALANIITQNLVASGQPLTVGIDGDKLTNFFQSKPPGDLEKFAADMGIKPEDITNAASTGGSVDLPIGHYQAKYAGNSDLDAAISQDLRFAPGGLSANEMQGQVEQVQQLNESIKAELQKTATGQGSELPSQIKDMRDTLMQPKAEGGAGYSAEQADSQVSVLMAGLRHIAVQRGENVEQTVKRIGLGLKVGDIEPSSEGLVVRNQNATLSEADIQGAEDAAQRQALPDFPILTDTQKIGAAWLAISRNPHTRLYGPSLKEAGHEPIDYLRAVAPEAAKSVKIETRDLHAKPRKNLKNPAGKVIEFIDQDTPVSVDTGKREHMRFVFDPEKKTVAVRSEQMAKSKRGTAYYQAGYDYAKANGYTRVPDNALTPAGRLRTTAHALSSGLRHDGDLSHWTPSREHSLYWFPHDDLDNFGDAERTEPNQGDHLHNLGALASRESDDILRETNGAFSQWSYDFHHDHYTDEFGKPIPHKEVDNQIRERLERNGGSRNLRVGPTSVKRALVTSGLRGLEGNDAERLQLRVQQIAAEGSIPGSFPPEGLKGIRYQGGDGPDGPRGAIAFGDGKSTIHLFKTADLSTVLHETGHLFLREMQGLVAQGVADDRTRADLQTLHDFAGAKPGAALDREGEEKIVRAFEAYLREGKAPSVELSGPFSRFRTWLTSIYRSISSLGVQPTDGVKQVFDRMLASEDDIAHAQEYYSRKGEVLDLIKAEETAKQPVREKLATVQKTELDKQTSAYLKSYLKAVGGVSTLRQSAKEAVDAQPIYKVLETAKTGKIDEDSLRSSLGTKGFNEFIEKFPNLISKKGEHTLDSLAIQHNFESPETLGDNLMGSVPKSEAVTNYTRRLVAEKEAQLRDEIVKNGATPADGVMHSDASLAYLIAETHLMASQLQRGRPVRINAQAYRDAAKQAIDDMRVRKAVRYSDFARTEARLSSQVLDFAKKGKWEDALQARKKQMAQHAMVQEAIKVRDERADIVRRFSPAKLEEKLKNVDNQYVAPVRQILSTYGLSDIKPGAPYDLTGLKDVDQTLYSQIPDWLLRGANAGDYADLTWSQLKDVDNTVRGIMSFGSDLRKSNLEMEEKTIGDIVGKSVKAVNALPLRDVRQLSNGAFLNVYTTALQKLDWLKSHITKAQFLFKILDNFSEERNGHTGIMSKMFQGMRVGEHDQSEAQRKVYDAAKPHLQILAKATDRLRKENGQYFSVAGVDKPDAYRETGRANWSPEELVSYMLNTGAEGNLAALKNAFGHGPQEIQRVAAHFTANELHAVDGLRDSIGTMFSGLNDTNFKLYNRSVDKVDAVPSMVTSLAGNQVDLRGGYWPLVFDYEINRLRGQYVESDVLDGQIKAFLRSAKPEDGMTKSRVTGHSLAPRLDMGVFADHVDDTTRFIHLAPLLRDMDRVMQNSEWKQAVISKVGADQYEQVRDWLSSQATPARKQTTNLMRGVDKVADYARATATASALGFNFVAGLKWRTSMINSAVALGGWRHIANGYAGLGTKGLGTSILGLTNSETWKLIENKSKLLGPREVKGIRDIRDDVQKLKWNQTEFKIPGTDKTFTTSDLKHAMYEWAKMNDRAVVAPVWMGGYMKYLNEMGEPGMTDAAREKAAVDYADSIIQTSQPSSLNVDMNSFQRNQPAFLKLFTMFMSYPYTIANRFMYMAKALNAGAITKKEYASHFFHEVLLEPLAREGIKYAALGTAIPAIAYALGPMSNLVAGIPGLNTLFNVAQAQFSSDEASPTFDIFRKVKNVADDVITGKDFTRLAWDVARLTAYLTKIPALNVAKTLLDFRAEATGEKQPLK